MKNAMKFGLALVAFLTAFTMHANDTNFSVSVKSGKVINFVINETKNVHVSIYSTENVAIFDEVLKSKDGKITRTYDLAALPSGTYYLETETPAKVSRHEIVINGATATVTGKTLADIYKPVLIKKDGLVSVSILNNEKTPVEIKVYDENSNELYSEIIKGEQTLSKTFDIRNTTAQNFTLVTSYNNKTFVETIAAR
ncbi:hypothetical protein GR160_16670 [Flavobacterium sp. Sd200]|uniref:hypothetical protein n=1 Tax=Flavobacterium sp. Sd200 TaxID=2692211 RepID=UPI00136C5317|nr:hypothetical protein [Flavobacterium sp. Sd200]MXN92863.1 hypothetical protein [Flavobacterium sp. Sd200]